jgi:hypothetical protein
MKAIEYMHSYGSKLSREEEMAKKFGELLHTEDTADSYEVAESHLYKKGDRYNWLMANGCSCWDGYYDGWSLTERELKKLALARSKDEDGYYGPSHEKLMAVWINENIN